MNSHDSKTHRQFLLTLVEKLDKFSILSVPKRLTQQNNVFPYSSKNNTINPPNYKISEYYYTEDDESSISSSIYSLSDLGFNEHQERYDKPKNLRLKLNNLLEYTSVLCTHSSSCIKNAFIICLLHSLKAILASIIFILYHNFLYQNKFSIMYDNIYIYIYYRLLLKSLPMKYILKIGGCCSVFSFFHRFLSCAQRSFIFYDSYIGQLIAPILASPALFILKPSTRKILVIILFSLAIVKYI